jgi:hypothetical protein
MRRHALAEQQTSGNETIQRRSQLCLRLAHYRSQQGVRKFPPDCRPDLSHLLGGPEPVKPRHQRRMQACRDRQGWRRNRGGGALGFALALRLQYRLRHLLHKQRNAVGTLHNFRHHIRLSRLRTIAPPTPMLTVNRTDSV